ncbi:transposase [Streptomyces sp. NPDC048304]|uniref:transposase n=1 Tax=Streptomyces sp. NPDC048304 TaxID=3154820 RepID=UPI0033F86070
MRAAATVPACSRGYDGGKKVPGRKRHIVTDCLGLLLVVAVTAANIGDRDAATGLLRRLRRLHRCLASCFEFVQFRTPRGDPLQQFGIQHASDRRRPSDRHAKEPANRPRPLLTRIAPSVPAHPDDRKPIDKPPERVLPPLRHGAEPWQRHRHQPGTRCPASTGPATTRSWTRDVAGPPTRSCQRSATTAGQPPQHRRPKGPVRRTASRHERCHGSARPVPQGPSR